MVEFCTTFEFSYKILQNKYFFKIKNTFRRRSNGRSSIGWCKCHHHEEECNEQLKQHSIASLFSKMKNKLFCVVGVFQLVVLRASVGFFMAPVPLKVSSCQFGTRQLKLILLKLTFLVSIFLINLSSKFQKKTRGNSAF